MRARTPAARHITLKACYHPQPCTYIPEHIRVFFSILHIRASNFKLYAISTLKSTRRNVNLLERISNKKSIYMHARLPRVGEERKRAAAAV